MRGNTRVLVIGPRRGLLTALDALGVRYVVWTDRAKRFPHADHVHVASLFEGRDATRRQAQALGAHGPFTHVIAGTEAAVVPASASRRVLGARVSSQTMILRCHDKLRMKQHLRGQGIPMAPFVDGNSKIDAKAIGERLGFPLVRKPRALSGGRGIEIVRDGSALGRTPSRGYLFEGYIDAPEVSVESFLNHGEILFENITEYARKQYVNVVPAQLDDRTRGLALELNRRVLQALRVSWGMTHVEMFLTHEGPLFGEIALRPPGGYIMDLLGLVWGFDPWRAYVSTEIDEPFSFPDEPRAHAAAVVLHPGRPGTVAFIRGLDDIRAHPAVVDARVRVGPGDRVPPRIGLGVDVGHILLSASSRDALLDAVRMVEERLVIEVTAS